MLGLCGGYQMLGRTIADPDGIEGPAATVAGLGLLDVETVLTQEKVTRPTQGIHVATGEQVDGYEIHLGRTQGPDCTRPVIMIGERPDGASSADGRVEGTYLHGVFGADAFRRSYLARLGIASRLSYEAHVEGAFDALARHLETHLDLDRLLAIARSR
jgi:adenosylcobyric acid synthase